MGCGVSSEKVTLSSKQLDFKPIHSAVRWNKPTSEIALLLDSPEAVNAIDPNNGNTPIHIASQNGHIDIVKLLIDKKAEINSKNLKGNTALHMAIGYDYFNVAKCLLDAGANPNEKNESGFEAETGLEGDKSMALAALISSKTKEDILFAFSLCEQNPDKTSKINFASAGLKVKKNIGDEWTNDIQEKFKMITTSVLK